MFKITKKKLLALCGLPITLLSFMPAANAGIIESYDGSKKINDSLGSGKDSLTIVNDPNNSNNKVYKHTISGGYRSESSLKKTKIGDTYWYGWSVFIPSDFKIKSFNIIAQQAAYPSKRDKKMPCGAVGHRMDIRENGDIYYASQHKGNQKGDMECVKYPLTKLDQVKGKWVHFVQHAKWTGDSDGFLKIWMRIGDKGDYKQLVDRKGSTWWNDEDKGPYLKVGVYGGSGNKGKVNTTLYSDNYKIGDSNSSFEEVAPK